MKKALIAVSAAIVLSIMGVVAPASAMVLHNSIFTPTCAGVVLHADSYDAAKTNTWSVTIGAVTQTGTFGDKFDQTFAVPQGGATTVVSAHIEDQDHTAAYTFDLPATSVGPCGVVPPAPPALILCTATGAWYTEPDDHAPLVDATGVHLISVGDAHATGYILPVNGNLQGITNISYVTSNVVGNGVFFRFIVDLTGDGLGAYNSFSITSNTIDQTSVANVGSKAVFLGKTVAQVAALYPHNKIIGIGIQTGSSYPAKDGALLTSIAGNCGAVNFVKPPVVTPPAPPKTPVVPVLAVTGVDQVAFDTIIGIAVTLTIAGALLLLADGLGLFTMFRKRKHRV